MEKGKTTTQTFSPYSHSRPVCISSDTFGTFDRGGSVVQTHHIGYGIRGFYWLSQLGYLWDMTPKDAQERFRILEFFGRFGLEATREAFGVSRRSLYRWKARLKASGGNPAAFHAQKATPRRFRRPKWFREVIQEIRDLRRQYPNLGKANLGKARIHVLLKPWCEDRGLPCPSESTIGRIISRAPYKMGVIPLRLDARGKVKAVKHIQKARKPKDFKYTPLKLWLADTIERVRDGIRRYIITFIDPKSRIAFGMTLPSKHSRHSAMALEALIEGNQGIEFLLSDNGSEFEGAFDELLKERGIQHYWTYPKSPKMNAHNERFNRTIQEQFVDFNEDLLFSDLEAFNREMGKWLIKYNTILPHHSLNLKPPSKWLMENYPECHKYWTNPDSPSKKSEDPVGTKRLVS